MKKSKSRVVFLNPRTCGIYKDGGPRFKTDLATGRRTAEIDNELKDHVDIYIAGRTSPGISSQTIKRVFSTGILVPTYYDSRYDEAIVNVAKRLGTKTVTLGELIDNHTLNIRSGHGSPSNDQRAGHIPYVKVSDIRGLRINTNPTNLVSEIVARRFWRGISSGLQAWDLITPNRASSNIGEFAILLPGEEQIVVTKEVFVMRVMDNTKLDPFYLLWALSLKAVREQWRRIALMQTNREDCGNRHREILLPLPKNKAWAIKKSQPFREYFQTIAIARNKFVECIKNDSNSYVANVLSQAPDLSDQAIQAPSDL